MQAVFWAVTTDTLCLHRSLGEKLQMGVSQCSSFITYIHTNGNCYCSDRYLRNPPPKTSHYLFLYTKQQFFQLDLETGLEIGADCLSHKQLGRVTQYSTKGQFRWRSIFHPFNYVISIKGHMGMMPNVNAVSGNQARVPKEKEFPYQLWK